MLDTTVKSKEDIEKKLGLSVLTTIPICDFDLSMKTVKFFLSALAALCMAALASCQKDDDSSDPVEDIEFTSGATLGGRYNDNITLRAGEYTLTSSLQIEAPVAQEAEEDAVLPDRSVSRGVPGREGPPSDALSKLGLEGPYVLNGFVACQSFYPKRRFSYMIAEQASAWKAGHSTLYRMRA